MHYSWKVAHISTTLTFICIFFKLQKKSNLLTSKCVDFKIAHAVKSFD